MDVQALIVVVCTAYAVWTLMPTALRRDLSAALLKLRLPAALARPFRRAPAPAPGCGGCDSCADAEVKPVQFHRRTSR